VINHTQKKDLPGCFVVHKKTCLGDLPCTKKTLGVFCHAQKELAFYAKKTCLGDLNLYLGFIVGSMHFHIDRN
jgi:hypothetical protein